MIILFDLDGTLIDSTEAILESFHFAFDFYGYRHPKDEDIKCLIGHPLDVMFARLGVEEARVWDFVTVYKEHYREISTQKTVLLARAKDAIIEASQFAELGIVTTKTGKYSRILMEHFSLMHYFKVLIGRENVTYPKPHAEPILKALEAFDPEDKDIWMIGDTQMDMIAAESAGVKAVGVLCGYATQEELEKFTDVTFSDTYEAIMWLKSRNLSHNELTL